MAPNTSNDEVFTAIAEFDIEPEQWDGLLETLTGELERWVRDRPGFITAEVHASPGGRHALVSMQWQSRHDWAAFVCDPEQAVLNDKLRHLGVGGSLDGRPYEVQEVIEAVPPRPWP